MTDHADHGHGEETYSLVMPFVVCQSQGGPYDDASFVAGCWFSKIEAHLSTLAMLGELTSAVVDYTVPTGMVPQLDLLAMHHGFTMRSKPWDEHPDEHTFVTFTCGEQPDDEEAAS